MVMAFGCAMLAGAIVLGAMWPKTYRSEAKLYVRLGRENVGTGRNREPRSRDLRPADQPRRRTQHGGRAAQKPIALGKSRRRGRAGNHSQSDARVGIEPAPSIFSYARATLQQGANWLTNDGPLTPQEKAVVALRRQIDMQNVRKTDVILVAHEGPSAAASQRIVSTLVNLYLDEHVRMSRSPKEHAFLEEQAASIKKQLVQRETELKSFKDQTGTGLARRAASDAGRTRSVDWKTI